MMANHPKCIQQTLFHLSNACLSDVNIMAGGWSKKNKKLLLPQLTCWSVALPSAHLSSLPPPSMHPSGPQLLGPLVAVGPWWREGGLARAPAGTQGSASARCHHITANSLLSDTPLLLDPCKCWQWRTTCRVQSVWKVLLNKENNRTSHWHYRKIWFLTVCSNL